MRKLLILSVFLPLLAWAQAATNLSEGEYFGVSSNVEIEASLQSGFLLFKKFAPIDRSSGQSLKMTCHGGGISALNRIRVSANGTFSGACELHHGKSISPVLDGVNNKNLEVKGTFPRLLVVSPNSEVGEIQVTLVPTLMRTEFHRLRNQGNITASSGLTNPTKSPAEADRAKENHVGGFQPNSSNQAAFTHSRQKIQAFFERSDLRNLSWRLKIESLVRFELVDWLSPTIGLEEIPTPSYPAALSLKQEPWETNKEFEDRVGKARTERRLAIDRLQAEYRTKVEERNKRIAEFNRTRTEREAQLPQKRRELVLLGISILNPSVAIADPALDQQSGALTVSLQVDGLGKQTFAFKDTPQAFRKSALTEPKAMKAKPEFQVSDAGEITLQAITVEAGGASVRGIPSAGITTQVQLATVNLPQASAPAIVQQSAISVDRNQVEQILYREENELLRKRLEEQRKQQEQALANEQAKAAAEIARIREEAKKTQPESRPVLNYAAVKDAHALVIGNSAYLGSNRLANPVNDAKAMSAKLRSLGFKVTELANTNREQMVRSLSEFSKTASRADLTLLFYAGHGVQISGTNYMIPVDMSLTDASQATLQAVSLNSVVEQYLPGTTKLVFLDACRDNPLMATVGRGITKGLAPINVSQGTLIAYATKDGQTAEDGVGKVNSPFTAALLEHLSDPEDIGIILRTVRAKVMAQTQNRQQPWEYGSLTGGALVLSAIKR